MRRFSHTLHFDYPPEHLLALFTSPRFLEEEALHQGSFRASCSVEPSQGGMLLRVDQVGPNRDPRSRVKESRQVIEYRWDMERRSCTWRRLPEKPDGVSVNGTHRVQADGRGGCEYLQTWELQVRLPVIGRLMEKKIESGVSEAMARRQAFARNWLRKQEKGS